MNKPIIILSLILISVLACHKKVVHKKPNTFLQITQLISLFYDEDAPKIEVNGDETAAEVFEELCKQQTKSYQTYFVQCKSCGFKLPVQFMTDVCNSDLADLFYNKMFYFSLDSSFSTFENNWMFEVGKGELVDLEDSVKQYLGYSYTFWPDLKFTIEVSSEDKIGEIINIASFIQKVYWGNLLRDAIDDEILFSGGSSLEEFMRQHKFRMSFRITGNYYYQCDCGNQNIIIGTRSGRY